MRKSALLRREDERNKLKGIMPLTWVAGYPPARARPGFTLSQLSWFKIHNHPAL
jgi:hypothetical protein